MHIPSSLESPATELPSAGPLLVEPRNYVTSPKVMEIAEPDTERRVALGWLGLIVAAALVLRLLLFALGPAAAAERAATDSSPITGQLAASLVTEQAFAYDPQRPVSEPGAREQLINLRAAAGQLEAGVGGLQPEVFHLPGYAMLMGLVDAAGGTTAWLLLLQCALAAACSALIYGIVRQATGKHLPGLVAAAIVALHPALVIAPLSICDDILFIFMVLLGAWAAVKQTTPMAVLAGVAIGCAVLIRPISIFVGPAVALWMILGQRKDGTFGFAITVAVMSLAIPALWVGRNIMIEFGPRLSAAPSARLAQTGAAVDALASGHHHRAGHDALMGTMLTGAGDVLDAMDTSSRRALSDHPLAFGSLLSHNAWHLMTDHRADRLYRVMGLTYPRGGAADALTTGRVTTAAHNQRDPASNYLALGWMGLNALLLIGTALGVALMAARRQGAMLLLIVPALVYLSYLAGGAGVHAWQPVALVFAAMACGSVLARGPKRLKLKKDKKPKKSRKQKRNDTVFDLDEEHTETDLATRGGLASRPI